MSEKPFDGMKEHRGQDPWRDLRGPAPDSTAPTPGPMFEHQPVELGYVMSGLQEEANQRTTDRLERARRLDAFIAWLEELVDEKDEDILYDAVDGLRRRWREKGPTLFGLAQVKTEGEPIRDPPSFAPSYRTLMRDRAEFGARSVKLARKVDRLRRKLRRARKATRRVL